MAEEQLEQPREVEYVSMLVVAIVEDCNEEREKVLAQVREDHIQYCYKEQRTCMGDVLLEQGHFAKDTRLLYLDIPCMAPVREGTSNNSILGSLKQFMSASN